MNEIQLKSLLLAKCNLNDIVIKNHSERIPGFEGYYSNQKNTPSFCSEDFLNTVNKFIFRQKLNETLDVKNIPTKQYLYDTFCKLNPSFDQLNISDKKTIKLIKDFLYFEVVYLQNSDALFPMEKILEQPSEKTLNES